MCGFRRDFEGSACDPAPKPEFKCKAAVRGGFAPGSGRATGSGVLSGFGGGDVRPSRRARRDARVEQREQAFAALPPPVPSERPFDELPVQVLAPKSVQDAEAPALEVREHAVDPLEDFVRGRVSDRNRRVVLQPVVAGPSVTIQVPGSVASSRNAFSVGPDWSMILRSLTHPGLFSPNTSTAPAIISRPSWPRPPGGGSEPLRR